MVIKGKREFAETVTIHTVESNKAGDFVRKNTAAGKYWSYARIVPQGKECEIYDFSNEFKQLQGWPSF